MRRASIALCEALGLAAVTTVAHAQEGDPAAAAELFAQGRQALQAREYDVACAKLTESERLDKKVGTLINLAQCEEGRGHLATSLRRWDEARTLAQATGDGRLAFVAQQGEALAPRVPVVRVTLSPRAPVGTRVSIDGGEVDTGEAPIPPLLLDGGPHVVVTTAPGRGELRFVVTVREGETQDLVVEPGPAATTEAVTPAPRSVPFWGPMRAAAIVSAAAGVVAAGVASVFGVKAIEARNEPGCSNGLCDTPAEAQVQHDGVHAGNVATIVFAGSGALIATGVVLWFTAPRALASSGAAASSLGIAPAPGGAAVTLRGSW